MNLLFLTLCEYDSIQDRDLYTDLLRVFLKRGDRVFLVSPIERRHGKASYLIREGNSTILRLKTGNVQKTNLLEKGVSTVTMESVFIAGIKKYFRDVRFDLVMYSTPPITLVGAVEYVKNRDHARTYLLLKDIFPQNAVDIGILKKDGPLGLLYRHFRRQEKKLYRLSDRIGCMSPANVRYVLAHNPELDPERVEVCANSIEIADKSVDAHARRAIREKYGIPADKTVFVYGGNLGKPQGIPFLIECLQSVRDLDRAFFLIVGDGTEYGRLKSYAETARQSNLRVLQRLPKEDYDAMVGGCDVGLIFLDHRFTIPNFPSRIVSYMQARLPVLACTDPCTDIGQVIEEGGFGWWCESNDAAAFRRCAETAMNADLPALGHASWESLRRMYDVEDSCRTILRSL